MPLLVASGQRTVALETLSAGGTTDAAGMNEQEFHAFYWRTARPLKAYLMSASGGDSALADDLLQESYFRFLRADFEAVDENHQRNYLFRIATNLVRDHFRRAKPQSDQVPERDRLPGHDEAIHLRTDVGAAMAGLAPRDRQMLWLAYVEGSSHQEIAKTLGLRTSSIRSMLFRARQRLAAELQARGLGAGVEGS